MFLDWLALPAGLRWIDIGCGTGALTEIILEKGNPGGVVGVEPSEGFLGVARSNVGDARAEFKTGDAQSLPLGNHAVDVGVAGLVLNFVPDEKRALDEIRRVVKPGGTIACYVWDYADSMQLIRHFWDAVAELFPDDAKRHEGKHFPLCKPQPLADLFRDADLRAVGICALDAPTVFSDFEDYWTPFLRRQGPAGVYCASLSDDGRERLRGYLENALPINADGTIHLIARAWAVRGTA